MENGGRYPATAYDRDINNWTVVSAPISQIKIASEVATCVRTGIPTFGGPLRQQLPDGSDGEEIGAVSVVWSRVEQDDGSRKVLGWYESGRN